MLLFYWWALQLLIFEVGSGKCQICLKRTLIPSCCQTSWRTRGCRMCSSSALEGNWASTGSRPSWRSTTNTASRCTTHRSPTETFPSWSSAARSWPSCRSASRGTGRRWSSEWSQHTHTHTHLHHGCIWNVEWKRSPNAEVCSLASPRLDE